VREIMRPRHEIVSIPVGSTLDEVLATMVESQHSRLPVWEGKPEQMAGVVYFKDMTACGTIVASPSATDVRSRPFNCAV